MGKIDTITGASTGHYKGKRPAIVLETSDFRTCPMSEYQKELLKWSRNVDKGYAWVALFALWMIMAITLGTYRVYALIYAKITEEGAYNREDASWPISTIFTTENIIGPIVSIIAAQTTFRINIFLGFSGLIIGTGIGYLSNSLWLDIVGIGLIQGVGFAFIFMPFMSAVNEYFVKYRSLATGVALTGGTISVFAWTPLFRWLLEEYNWRFSYLVICIVCSSGLLLLPLLRPNPRPKNPSAAEKESQMSERSRVSHLSARAFSYKSALRRQSSIILRKKRTSVISINPTATTVGCERRISRTIDDLDDRVDGLNKISRHISAPVGRSEPLDSISVDGDEQDDEMSETQIELSRVLTILKTPGFHVIWFVELIYFWSFTIYSLMMVEYGIDKGCDQTDAEDLIMYQSVGELIGRLGLGLVADMNFFSIRVSTCLSLGLMGAVLCMVPQAQGILWMASLTIAISAFGSLIYILLNGLLVDYLGEQNVTIGYGMSSFIAGLVLFFRPYAVGYFRDNIGSYDGLTWSLGICCVVGASVTLAEPMITKLFVGTKKDVSVDAN